MQRLTGACALFGAIFVITTAHFATHETLQRRPVYLAAPRRRSPRFLWWSRVCGGNGIDPNGMGSRTAVDQDDDRLALGQIARVGVETLGLLGIAAAGGNDLALVQERIRDRNPPPGPAAMEGKISAS